MAHILKAVPIKTGKVRELYDAGENLVIVTTDRISAFDFIQPTMIPRKGVILNQMTEFWFKLTKDIIPNHMITTSVIDMPLGFQTPEYIGRSMMVKKLKMIPIECIVRGYLTGSGWESYKQSGFVCGIRLFEELKECQKLSMPMYTPTTKSESGHDEAITYEDTIDILQKEFGDKGEHYARLIRDKSVELYNFCSIYAEKHGIIIADTKFEFGVDEDDNLVLADEMMTPDSSRFWPANKYEAGRPQESYDKQYLRDWLKENGYTDKPAPELPKEVVEITAEKYEEVFSRLVKDSKTS